MGAAGGPNTRPRKDRHPNWGAPKVMALINTKEKEHNTLKLAPDSRDMMESVTQRWTKIATDVSKASFSAHYRGAMAYKDKWQTLFADYKKISDYKGATGSREDYFHMTSKRRKDLTLPPNFCASHYKEMEKFLRERPCLNSPRQLDSFIEDDDDFQSTEDLAHFCAEHQITESMLASEDGTAEPGTQKNLLPPAVAGSSGPGLPRRPPASAFHASKGKEKLENAAKNLSPNPRPVNTAVRRRHSSPQSKMVEVTEMQGKEIVSNMQKLSDMEERKVAAVAVIADKQLQYFKVRDSEIAIMQRGLVQAVNGLSEAIVHAYASRSASTPPHRTSAPNPPPLHNGEGTGDGSPLAGIRRASVRGTGQSDSPVEDYNGDMLGSTDYPDGGIAGQLRRLDTPMEDSAGHVNINTDEIV
jgi:hypothetical protein